MQSGFLLLLKGVGKRGRGARKDTRVILSMRESLSGSTIKTARLPFALHVMNMIDAKSNRGFFFFFTLKRYHEKKMLVVEKKKRESEVLRETKNLNLHRSNARADRFLLLYNSARRLRSALQARFVGSTAIGSTGLLSPPLLHSKVLLGGVQTFFDLLTSWGT